jgi:hypothetical protein
MRMLRPVVALTVLVLAVGSSPAQTRSRPPSKPSPAEEKNSLLRMDLLQLPQGEMTPPQRNIFAPGARISRPVDNLPQGSQMSTSDDQALDTPDLQAEEAATPPVITVNLRYIGFIESSRRMIALVVLEGQAIAVVEGEVVGEGIRISKITREQVEIVLPDSSTRLFSLEGE